MNYPLFSIIVPVFNRARLVGETLESIFKQESSDYEVIAVDDGSTDESLAVLRQFEGRVRVLTQENSGPAEARNHALREARGRYAVFLDSDDLWFPWTLTTYATVIQQCGGPSLILGSRVYFDEPEDIATTPSEPLEVRRYGDYLASQRDGIDVVGTGTIAAERNAALKAGGFPSIRCNSEDIDFALRMGVAPGCVMVLSPAVVAVRRHEGRATNDYRSTFAGLEHLLSQEAKGRFPGGADRELDRWEIIGFQVRSIAGLHLRCGSVLSSVGLYIRTFGKHVRLKRWRYLFLFPAWLIVSLMKRAMGGYRQ